jgi:small GTP-binding protein
MWDTAGHERFRAMTPLYYRGARIALIVFAVDDPSSLNEVEEWHKSVVDTLGETIPTILIANKIDLPRVVRPEEGQEKAAKIGARYVETSAVTGVGLPTLFEQIGEIVVADMPSQDLDDIRLTMPVQEKRGCC